MDYCDITKQHFRELEETVQKVIDAADELNSKIGKNPPETAKSRVQTVASIRTLTGSVRSSSAAVQSTYPPIWLLPLGPVTYVSDSIFLQMSMFDTTDAARVLTGITSARNTGTGVSVRDVSRLRAQLR